VGGGTAAANTVSGIANTVTGIGTSLLADDEATTRKKKEAAVAPAMKPRRGRQGAARARGVRVARTSARAEMSSRGAN
jgi:hypothetical protein